MKLWARRWKRATRLGQLSLGAASRPIGVHASASLHELAQARPVGITEPAARYRIQLC